MPLVKKSTYSTIPIFRQAHINSIAPSIFREATPKYKRETIDTPDQDFIDVDWSTVGSDKLIILLHGLEGSSQSSYARGFVQYANQNQWDVAVMNYRGCSGRINKKVTTYHIGKTDDVDWVIKHIYKHKKYTHYYLVGFSLGGSLTLKYLGEKGQTARHIISKAVALSVPCDALAASFNIENWSSYIFKKYFISKYNNKLKIKRKQFEKIGLTPFSFKRSTSLRDFDAWYIRLFGYKNLNQFYKENSCLPYIDTIKTPVLLINAKDDPILTKSCFPVDKAKKNAFFHLEIPAYGGHCGFIEKDPRGIYWSDKRIISFLSK